MHATLDVGFRSFIATDLKKSESYRAKKLTGKKIDDQGVVRKTKRDKAMAKATRATEPYEFL